VATRLTFLCAAATASSRTGAFPCTGEPLDGGGRRKASDFDRSPHADVVVSSPSRSAIETTGALGLEARIESCLADLDYGEWAGRSIADIQAKSPDQLGEWFADPTRAVPGGETMEHLLGRVGAWMDRQLGNVPATLIVSHASVMRAALAHALAIPLASALQIDIAPLATLDFSHNGRWRLQELRRRP